MLYISAPSPTLALPPSISLAYTIHGDLSTLPAVPLDFAGPVIIDDESIRKTILNQGPSLPDWHPATRSSSEDLAICQAQRPKSMWAIYDLPHTDEIFTTPSLFATRWNNLALSPLLSAQQFISPTCYVSGDYDPSPWWLPNMETACMQARLSGVPVLPLIGWRYFGDSLNLQPQKQRTFQRNCNLLLSAGADGLILWCGHIFGARDGDEYYCRQSLRNKAEAPSNEHLEIDQAAALYGTRFLAKDGSINHAAIDRYCTSMQSRYLSWMLDCFQSR